MILGEKCLWPCYGLKGFLAQKPKEITLISLYCQEGIQYTEILTLMNDGVAMLYPTVID